MLAEKALHNSQMIRRNDTQRNNQLGVNPEQANKTIAVDAPHRLLEIKELKVRLSSDGLATRRRSDETNY